MPLVIFNFTSLLFLLLLPQLPSPASAQELEMKGNIGDFCPAYRSYDERNAYVMGIFANLAYSNLKTSFDILTGSRATHYQLPDSSTFKSMQGAGFTPENVRYFSSDWKNPYKFSAYYRDLKTQNNLTMHWLGHPLPVELCYKPIFQRCVIDSTDSGCDVPYNVKNRNTPKAPIMNPSELSSFIREAQSHPDGPQGALLKSRLGTINRRFRLRDDAEWTLPRFFTEALNERRNCGYHELNLTDYLADTQATWIENDDFAVVAFRGTEMPIPENIQDATVKLTETFWQKLKRLITHRDISTDLSMELSDCLNELLTPLGIRKGLGPLGHNIMFHHGFCQASVASMDWLRDQIKKMKPTSDNKPKPLFITGHSLGGAVGTLTYYALMNAKETAMPLSRNFEFGGLFTYGSPRVGNLEFSKHFVELAKKYEAPVFRHVNDDDLVTRVPFSSYFHVGELHWFNRTLARWFVNPTSLDPIPVDPTSSPELAEVQRELVLNHRDSLIEFPYLYLLTEGFFRTEAVKIRAEAHRMKLYIRHLQLQLPRGVMCRDEKRKKPFLSFWFE